MRRTLEEKAENFGEMAIARVSRFPPLRPRLCGAGKGLTQSLALSSAERDAKAQS